MAGRASQFFIRNSKFFIPVLLLSACTSLRNDVGTASAPSREWTPPASAVPQATPVSRNDLTLPANFTPGMPITLPQVVDIALSNNPATRIAWLQARSAQAALGSAESAFYPEVGLNAQISTSRNANGAQTSFGPSVALNYLLFDFGGRAASVEGARQTLIGSNFLHNQAIQNVILQVQQTYYGYLDNRALLAAEDAAIKERQTSLAAAEARHNAGVATIADVLQARTQLSQAQLNRETFAGNLRVSEGLLATAMGLPATTRFDFGELPLDIPTKQVSNAVEALINEAVAQRPDLAAARAFAERAQQRIREVQSAYLPSVGLSSSAGQSWLSGGGSFTPYSVGVSMRWPIFTGFRNIYDVRQARIESQIATEDLRSLENQVNLQVWTSYYDVQTSTARLTTARDLLNTASQSLDVAQSRYRAGVGSILDVLTAQSALESARAQEVQARTAWFVSVAQLAHATGSLDLQP